ncbi:sensor histidine kinase [Xanthomonas sp. XNM01]|uniref:sensor histidine kinase n=1 Tax=Xanthomonas sp. XNM01 TaxID=2769289 RepID=UPI00178572DA|nr:sensor histidine kinase [Xanthomonas sp. XNM01]
MRSTPRPFAGRRPARRPLRRLCGAVAVCAWLWLCVGAGLAGATELRTRTGLPGFAHSGWPVGEHTPGDVWDIAQSDDGYLWLATGMGLYRFDGRSFVRQVPASGGTFHSHNMTTLKITANGDLWIGHFSGGISRLSRGVLTRYGRDAGVPEGMVYRIETDASGGLWAAVEGGLRRFDGERWAPPEPDRNYHADSARWLLRDRRGVLWVNDGARLQGLAPGTRRFEPSGVDVGGGATLAEHPDGSVWAADVRQGLLPVTAADGRVLSARERQQHTLPGLRAVRIRFQRDGSLWGSDPAGGVFRIRLPSAPGQPARVERFGLAQGLTSNTAVPLLEDREGNVWVGTNLGLNRFSPRALRVLAWRFPETTALHSLYRTPDGTVIGYDDAHRAVRLDRGLVDGPETAQPLPAPPATTPLWLAQTGRLWRRDRDGTHPLLDDDDRPHGYLFAAAFPADDEAWICRGSAAPAHLHGGRWRPEPALPGGCTAIAVASGGRLLFGYPDGTLQVRDAAGVTVHGRAQGLDVGPVTALLAQDGQLLVAGERGLAIRCADGRFRQVLEQPDGLLDAITGIALDAQGRLWLNGGRGLVRVPLDAARQAAETGAALETWRLYDAVDGLPGIAQQAHPTPTAQLAADGLLWLVTNQGLAWLDTREARAAVPPQVFISDITLGDRRLPYRADMVLPEGTTQLRIGYLATSLTRPARVHYRVQLEGVDAGWQDTGDIQQANYTNLKPGDYRFRVIAANEDGAWNTTGASGRFRIAPAFVQTPLFKVACVVLVIAALLLGLRLRSRQLARRVRARLEERYRERERIARELHDTLLQGTQGLILRLHASSLALAPDHPVRRELETAMDLAEQSLAQGRDRLRGLRDSRFDGTGLGQALLQVRNEVVVTDDVDLRMLVEGTPRPLRQAVAEELYLIGREALLNAFRHARARQIEIELGYDRRELRLRVRDDGVGLPDEAELQTRSGHWGLRGMAERAERIGARIQVWSRADAGTEVQIAIPARKAYLPSQLRTRWPWPRRPAPPETNDDE